MKCGLRSAGGEDGNLKCEESLALQCGRTQVMFLDGKSATHSHTARTRGLGWRTAHASSIDGKGFIVYP